MTAKNLNQQNGQKDNFASAVLAVAQIALLAAWLLQIEPVAGAPWWIVLAPTVLVLGTFVLVLAIFVVGGIIVVARQRIAAKRAEAQVERLIATLAKTKGALA